MEAVLASGPQPKKLAEVLQLKIETKTFFYLNDINCCYSPRTFQLYAFMFFSLIVYVLLFRCFLVQQLAGLWP